MNLIAGYPLPDNTVGRQVAVRPAAEKTDMDTVTVTVARQTDRKNAPSCMNFHAALNGRNCRAPLGAKMYFCENEHRGTLIDVFV